MSSAKCGHGSRRKDTEKAADGRHDRGAPDLHSRDGGCAASTTPDAIARIARMNTNTTTMGFLDIELILNSQVQLFEVRAKLLQGDTRREQQPV